MTTDKKNQREKGEMDTRKEPKIDLGKLNTYHNGSDSNHKESDLEDEKSDTTV